MSNANIVEGYSAVKRLKNTGVDIELGVTARSDLCPICV